jgi:DNA-binding SARP family transcriptional activator
MRVALLGPVSAESGGTELGLGGLKQRAVFALLALNAGRVVSLDRLVDELWPEEPPSRATLGLQSYVSRLRRVLASAVPADPGVPQLVTRPPGWLLDLDPALVDVTRFEDLLGRARQACGGDAARLLREALGLWRGEPLADLQTVPFARAEAARLSELRLAAQEALLEAALASGEADGAVAEARRFVAANPLRERAWQALASGLYASGRQSEALAALARLRGMLGEELGLDPAPETQALEAAILRHDPTLTPTSPDAPAPHDAPVAAVPPAADQQEGDELLGRGAALAAVDQAVRMARSGRGSLLVLEAPAGAGKTSLLRAVADQVTAAGGHAVHGSGVGAGAMPALWPWVTIVRQVASLLESDAAPSPDNAAGHTLSAMRAGDPMAGEASGRSSPSRTGLYRGVVDLLLAARDSGPLAVVLDDMQWMDGDSLDLLALAVDELVERGVVIAVAVRTGEPGTDDVAVTLRRVRREAVVRLPLPGLDVDDVGIVVRRLAGRPVEVEVAAVIHERTLGNPFFVGEVVRLLASEQRLDPVAVHDALPAAVEDVLRRRLDRLPPQTVALLTVAALAGGPVDVDTLVAMTGLDPDAVLDACESALLAELLVEDQAGFALRHDLVRQTLEHGVSRARRARLHARLADTIRARPALTPQDVVSIARHLTVAEPVVGPAAPIPYLLTAADDALSRNAHREAERLLEQALDLAGRIPEQPERMRRITALHGRLTIARLWGGRSSRGDATTGEGLDALPSIDESATAWANALINRGLTGHYDEVTRIAEATLERELPPAARARAHFVAGWAQLVRGRLDDADRHLRAFEELHDLAPDLRPLDVAAAGYAALVAHCAGDDVGAERADRLARARAARHEESTRMEAELYSAWLAAMRGRAEACREAAVRCAVIAEGIDSPVYAAHSHLLAAWAETLLGDREAARRADEAYERVVASGVLLFVPFFLLLRAEAHAVSGRPDRGAELVAEAAANSSELGDVPRAPRLLAIAEDLAPGRAQGSRKV